MTAHSLEEGHYVIGPKIDIPLQYLGKLGEQLGTSLLSTFVCEYVYIMLLELRLISYSANVMFFFVCCDSGNKESVAHPFLSLSLATQSSFAEFITRCHVVQWHLIGTGIMLKPFLSKNEQIL